MARESVVVVVTPGDIDRRAGNARRGRIDAGGCEHASNGCSRSGYQGNTLARVVVVGIRLGPPRRTRVESLDVLSSRGRRGWRGLCDARGQRGSFGGISDHRPSGKSVDRVGGLPAVMPVVGVFMSPVAEAKRGPRSRMSDARGPGPVARPANSPSAARVPLGFALDDIPVASGFRLVAECWETATGDGQA